jgi:glycosyltransferase involved in cell wall biosynthesis
VSLVLDAVESRPEVTELVIVDDGSTDSIPDILASRSFTRPAPLVRPPVNRGKGAATCSSP